MGGYTSQRDTLTETSVEPELVNCILSRVNRQVRNLCIQRRGTMLRVTGTSRTYYAKQLVTHAILSAWPTAQLENEITVLAS